MKDTMAEYTIPAVSESPIMDVFPYFSGEESETKQLEKFIELKDSVPVKNDFDQDLELTDVLSVETE